MKTIVSFFTIIGMIFFWACSKDENKSRETFKDTGTLFVSGGLYDCPYQIIMDDSSVFHPFNREVLTPFKSGQLLNFSYQLAPESTACNGTTGITILEVKLTRCLPYVDLYFYNSDSLKNDPINVVEAFIENDCLILELNYSGCTTDQPIDLSRIHPSCGTPPLPPPTFFINHNSRNESCEMLVTKTLSYDLTPLRDEGNNVDFVVHYSISETEVESLNFTYTY